MGSRAYVDPRFPALLRELRAEREWSLRDLAREAVMAKSAISQYENAVRKPTLANAEVLDQALGAEGRLAALVTPVTTAAEAQARIDYALTHPLRIDAPAVAALAEVLAAQRRLDDTLPAHAMLTLAEPQWSAVMALAKEARGEVEALHEVAAEWTQFLGWLHAEARHDADAVRLLTEAIRQADTTGNGTLSAQARNFRGYVERQRGNPRGIARYFEEAYHTPGAATLQRVGDAAQAAHGYGLLGEERIAQRLLGEASDLVNGAVGVAPGTAYWLSPSFSRLNLGLAYLGLGDRAEAAQHLRAGLAGLPPEMRAAEWTVEYRRLLASATD